MPGSQLEVAETIGWGYVDLWHFVHERCEGGMEKVATAGTRHEISGEVLQ